MTQSDVLTQFDATFNELFALKSIIKLTREICLDKEVNSFYYNLSEEYKKSLSEERNHYINMLSIALDKVANIENISETIEKEIPSLQKNSDYSC